MCDYLDISKGHAVAFSKTFGIQAEDLSSYVPSFGWEMMPPSEKQLAALEKFGIHVSDRETLYPFIGPPLADSFSKYFGFDEEQALQAVEYYREYFRAGGIFENVVYEGIPEMLRELKRRDAVVALATSKPYEFSVSILDHFDLHQYFDFVGAATMDGRISWKADVIRHLLGTIVKANTFRCGCLLEFG